MLLCLVMSVIFVVFCCACFFCCNIVDVFLVYCQFVVKTDAATTTTNTNDKNSTSKQEEGVVGGGMKPANTSPTPENQETK